MVLSDCSMDRVDERIGPALVCRLLNWEKRECGSMILRTTVGFITSVIKQESNLR